MFDLQKLNFLESVTLTSGQERTVFVHYPVDKSLCHCFLSGEDPCRPALCILFDFQPIRGEVSKDRVWGPGVLH